MAQEVAGSSPVSHPNLLLRNRLGTELAKRAKCLNSEAKSLNRRRALIVKRRALTGEGP